MPVPNSKQSFCLSMKCDRNHTVTIYRTLMQRTRKSVFITKQTILHQVSE